MVVSIFKTDPSVGAAIHTVATYFLGDLEPEMQAEAAATAGVLPENGNAKNANNTRITKALRFLFNMYLTMKITGSRYLTYKGKLYLFCVLLKIPLK
jgi:hypothetical protein